MGKHLIVKQTVRLNKKYNGEYDIHGYNNPFTPLLFEGEYELYEVNHPKNPSDPIELFYAAVSKFGREYSRDCRISKTNFKRYCKVIEM